MHVTVRLEGQRRQALKREHANATRAGMDRAKGEGKHVGRPLKELNIGRARGILAGLIAVHGRTKGIAAAAIALGVSVSTLRRAEKEWTR